MRLLLVEDTADLAESLLAHLRAEGHAIDHVGDAEGARAALAAAFDADPAGGPMPLATLLGQLSTG